MRNAAVIGLGTMGPGIAATLARAGMKVAVFDSEPDKRVKAGPSFAAAATVLSALNVPDHTVHGISVHDSLAACVAGAGIAQVLALSVESLVDNGTLIDLFPDWPGETFPLFAIRPSRRLPPAKVEAFLDFCADVCRRVARSSAS